MKFPAAAIAAWGTALVVGLGLGAAGCGGGSAMTGEGIRSDPAASAKVQRAVDLTREAGSAKILIKVVSGAAGTQTVESIGVFDYRRNMGRVQLRLPTAKTPVIGVITPRTLYVQGRPLSQPNRWRAYDLTAMGSGALLGGGVIDPSLGLELLRGAVDARRVGTDQIDGVRVTHYQGSLDVQRALSQAPANSPAALLGAAVKNLSQLRVPFDAYLDDQGRVRWVVQVMKLRYVEGKGGPVRTAAITTTTRLSDFGTPVAVRVPRPEELQRTPTQQPSPTRDPARR